MSDPKKPTGFQEKPAPNRGAMHAVALALKGDTTGVKAVASAAAEAAQGAARRQFVATADPSPTPTPPPTETIE